LYNIYVVFILSILYSELEWKTSS